RCSSWSISLPITCAPEWSSCGCGSGSITHAHEQLRTGEGQSEDTGRIVVAHIDFVLRVSVADTKGQVAPPAILQIGVVILEQAREVADRDTQILRARKLYDTDENSAIVELNWSPDG